MKRTYRLYVPNSVLNDNFEVRWKHACLIDGKVVLAIRHIWQTAITSHVQNVHNSK